MCLSHWCHTSRGIHSLTRLHSKYCTVVVSVLSGLGTFIYNLLLTQPDGTFYLDVPFSIRDLRHRSFFKSSSGSCHSRDAMWQEIDCMCGSVCSCRVLVQMCTTSLIYLVFLLDFLSKIVDAGQLITWWSVKADLFCSDKLDRCWLVNGLFVVASTSVLCS